MTYDTKTYGQSPFGNTTAPPKENSASEALSDQLAGRQQRPVRKTQLAARSHKTSDSETDAAATASSPAQPPALPADYSPVLKPKPSSLPTFYLPKGRTGLPILGEMTGWLMAWGTVGFFRSYVPEPVITFFDGFFSPWGMAGVTLFSALLIGRRFRHYSLKLAAVRKLATTAIEYGEAHHQADVQASIYDLLTQAEADTQRLSAQTVSWLTALGALFIIGAFY